MFEGVSRVHFVGIGGIGVSALAKWFLRRGATVSGSDMASSSVTEELDRLGVRVHSGHAAGAVENGVQLVVYSAAVPETNPEREAATAQGIPQLSYPEALGQITRAYSTIAVCGTNGKSTTTAMIGLILAEAGYDPTVIVGTKVPGFPDGNLRMGKGRFLVVEACEYREHFLQLEPEMTVVTNIEEDHLDYFRDLAHIRSAFQTFVDKLKGKGLVVWNADDPESKKLVLERGVSYGWTASAGYEARLRRVTSGQQTFELLQHEGADMPFGDLSLSIPGAFNATNALAAAAACAELGVPFETIKRALAAFTGTWRRFERVGVWKGADIFSDYGHHPTAIRSTIEAVREFFPGRRIVLCFQPHQHERTKTLFDGFVETLALADVLIVPEIYEVAGRTEAHDISSRNIVETINSKHAGKDARYAADLSEAESVLRDLIQPTDILLIQGAGDVDTLARKLAE